MLLLVMILVLTGRARAGVEPTRQPGWSAWRWTAEDGLPLDSVTSLAFDTDGIAWIGTFDGLARFDGHRFEVFRPGAHPGMPSARITGVAVAPDGTVFHRTESAALVAHTPRGFEVLDGEALGVGRIACMVAGPTALWAGGTHGLLRIDGDGARRVPLPSEATGSRCRSLVPGPDGPLLTLTSGDVLRLPPDDAPPEHLGIAGLAPGQDSPGRWRQAGPRAVLRYGGGLASLRDGTLSLRLPGADAQTLPTPGGRGALTLGPGGELHLWSSAGHHRLAGEAWVADPTPLPVPDGSWWVAGTQLFRGTDLVLDLERGLDLLAEDADGGVWVSEDGRGILHVRRGAVSSQIADEHGPLGIVRTVLGDRDGGLWINSERGLRRWAAGHSRLVTDADGAVITDALSMVQEQDGTLLVSIPRRACRIPPHRGTGPIRCLPLPHTQAWIGDISLTRARDGTLWAGSGRLSRMLPGQPPEALTHPETWTPIRSIVELGDGSMLVSAVGAGLWRAQGADLELRADAPGSPLRAVRSILVDERGDAWLGTEGQGLCRLRTSRGGRLAGMDLDCIGPEDGLADPFISSLVSDRRGRLWMSSNRGLHAVRWEALLDRFEGRLGRVPMISLGRHDGMVEPETNGMLNPAVAVSADGALWYPTMNGVARLDPTAVDAPRPPRVVLEAVRTPDTTWREPPTPITLPEHGRELTVEWTAPAFQRPESLRYRYRLAGLDADWRPETTARSATWTTLPPGDYRVEVQAGWGGTWGPPQTLAAVSVPATFRETPWFWAALGGIGAGLMGLLVWGRLRQARQRARQLQRAVDAATTELAARNHRLVNQAAELSEKRQALQDRNDRIAAQAEVLAERNARVAAQAEALAERNERVAAQAERLEQLDQVRTRFVANISHELRTPLTLIRGTLDDAVKRAPASLARPLDMAWRNAERLGELVEQLLDVARLDAGGVPLRARPDDLGRWLGRVLERFEASATARGVTLRLRAPGGLIAWFDPDLLEKVVTNLVANGLDHCPHGGRLEVAVAAGAEAAVDTVEITVTDTGPGVPEALQDRLFERFFQADDSDRRSRGGAGIGLALAREIVAKHGGEIGVANAEGAGARFWVRLPLGAAHLSVDEVALAESPAPHPAARPPRDDADAAPWAPRDDADGAAPIALLVEDHPDMRAWMADHLGTAFQVALAEDGQAALARLREGLQPAVVVSDVMMPNLDGLGLCRALRADPRWAELPVLLVTAKATQADRITGLEVAEDYLTKPFRAAELVMRARRLARAAEPERPPDPMAPRDPTAPHDAEAEPAATEPEAPPPSAFIERLEAVALEKLDDQTFGVAELAKGFGLSRRQLQRRLREETTRSPAAWLRELRLQRAQELIRDGRVETVGEAAALVGMSRSYLSRLYAQWAGRSARDDLQR